jgi:hypothetical protein
MRHSGVLPSMGGGRYTENKSVTFFHNLYFQLGKTEAERQDAYRSLYRGRMPERELTAIREATNKAWVLGDDRFKAEIEARTGWRAVPLGRGQKVYRVSGD